MRRGQRAPLDAGLLRERLRVDLATAGWPSRGWGVMAVCLGPDQVATPGGVAIEGGTAASGAVLVAQDHATVDLSAVPAGVDRVQIGVYVHEDERARAVHGRGFTQVAGRLGLGGRVVESFELAGSDLGSETALSLFEFYRKDGAWRVLATGTGFVGGLRSFLSHFRAEVPALPSPASPPSPIVAAPARPAPSRGGTPVELPDTWAGGGHPALPGGLVPAVGMLLVESPEGLHGGTAWAVSPGGWLVTCHHCVDQATRIEWIQEGTDRRRTASVVALDAEGDLALLHLDDRFGVTSWMLLAPPVAAPRLGDELGLLGYPLGTQLGVSLTYSQGVVNSVRRKGDVEVLQVDTGAAPGSSGGPVFRRSDGRVVGILTSGVMQAGGMLINFATRAERLSTLRWLGTVR